MNSYTNYITIKPLYLIHFYKIIQLLYYTLYISIKLYNYYIIHYTFLSNYITLDSFSTFNIH